MTTSIHTFSRLRCSTAVSHRNWFTGTEAIDTKLYNCGACTNVRHWYKLRSSWETGWRTERWDDKRWLGRTEQHRAQLQNNATNKGLYRKISVTIVRPPLVYFWKSRGYHTGGGFPETAPVQMESFGHHHLQNMMGHLSKDLLKFLTLIGRPSANQLTLTRRKWLPLLFKCICYF